MQQGDKVPNFTSTNQLGESVQFHDLLAAGPAVVFFYPKAFTPGCTKESCHFRDLAGEFTELGAQRIGVSADTVDKQASFDEKYQLGFPLLSDGDRAIAKLFGVKRMGPLMNKRSTFVIDSDGTVLRVISSEMNMETHADEALKLLRERAAA